MTRTRTRTPAAVLLASLIASALLAIAPAAPASAAGATGWIRAGHLSAGTPAADVRLAPFSGGKPRVIDSVEFGSFSAYTQVPTGLYTVSLVRAGAPMSASPMISQNVRVNADSASTVIATGTSGRVRATVVADDLRPPSAGQAKVRLISASTDPKTVDAQVVDGPTLAQDVSTGTSTGYAEVAAQTWEVALSSSSGEDEVVNRVPVKAGGIYTLVALTTESGDLELRAVNDSKGSVSATGSMPTGGVATGGGALAHEHDSDLALLAAGTMSALAIGSLVVLRSRRRRVTR